MTGFAVTMNSESPCQPSPYPDMRPHPHERPLIVRRRGGLITQGPLYVVGAMLHGTSNTNENLIAIP